MNFLAHVFLSGNSRDLIIGNFIADSVRGKEIEQFRQGIQEGIELHRKIDYYTDRHSVVQQTVHRLKPFVGRYAPVVSDIYYDHFLAKFWSEYSDTKLEEYTQEIYRIIRFEIHQMPKEVQYFFPYMEKNNWLYNYQFMYGMERAFEGMSKRAKFNSHMEEAVAVLQKYYLEFEQEFRIFFPELRAHVATLIK